MKFSVVTPSFGQLNHLGKCVASVHDQEGVEVEHWIQDGGTEGFDEWLKKIKSQLPSNTQKLDGISEPDLGMYDAINKGWKRARGDILSWLNCDEQYLENSLEDVAKCFEKYPDVGIVVGDVILLNSNYEPYSYRRVVPTTIDFIRYCHLPIFSAGCFVRRQIIQDLGHFLDSKWKAIGDAIWMEELLNSGVKLIALSQPVAVFVQTGQNLGASEVSFKEGNLRRIETGCQNKLKSKWEKMKHHFKKWEAGAYQTFSFDGRYYQKNFTRRIRIVKNISWRWE